MDQMVSSLINIIHVIPVWCATHDQLIEVKNAEFKVNVLLEKNI